MPPPSILSAGAGAPVIGRVLLLGAAVSAFFGTRSVRGQDRSPTHLEYRAPADCPAAQVFAERVRQRAPRVDLATEGAFVRVLTVEISNEAGGKLGTLRLVEANGAERVRTLRAATCREMIDGLSLIAAVSLDPEALIQLPEKPLRAPDETAPAKPPDRAPTNPGSANPGATKPTPKPAEHTAPRPPASNPTRVRGGAGVAFVTWLGQSPKPLLGGAVYGKLEYDVGEWYSPELRVSIVHAERRSIPETFGEANFAFTTATLEACPVRLGADRVVVRLCALGGAGSMTAWGTQTFRPESHSYAVWTLGGSSTARVQLGENIELIGNIGFASSTRHQFDFASEVFFSTRRVGFLGSIGLGASFP